MPHQKLIMHSSVFLSECTNKDSQDAVVYSPVQSDNRRSPLMMRPNAATPPISTPMGLSSPSVTKILTIEPLQNEILNANRLGSNRDETPTGTPSLYSSRIVKFNSYGAVKNTKSQRYPCITKQVEVEMDNESDFDDFMLASNNTVHMMSQSLSALHVEAQGGGGSYSSTVVEPTGDVLSFVSFRRPSYRCCRICHRSLPSAANYCPQCGSTVEAQSERSCLSNVEAESSLSSALVSPKPTWDLCTSFTTASVAPSWDVDTSSERSACHRRVYYRQVRIFNRNEKGWLGHGANGAVYKAIDLVSGQQFAVKEMCINLQNKSEIVAIRNELRHMSRLRHPKVIEYYGCSIEHATSKASAPASVAPLDAAEMIENKGEAIRVYILMERMECGTLQGLLKDLPDGFPECTVRAYTAQLLEAIHYVHLCGMSHCDIKPSNLLLASDGTIKLADFGCAKMRAAQHSIEQPFERELTGTPVYMPPETLSSLRIGNADWVFLGQAQDIWALGCVVHQLLTGKIPWAFTEITSPFAFLTYIQEHPQFPLSDELSPCARDFCRLCLEIDPRIRVENMDKILESPFIHNTACLCE